MKLLNQSTKREHANRRQAKGRKQMHLDYINVTSESKYLILELTCCVKDGHKHLRE